MESIILQTNFQDLSLAPKGPPPAPDQRYAMNSHFHRWLVTFFLQNTASSADMKNGTFLGPILVTETASTRGESAVNNKV